jgi:hypothetical protein
MKKLITLIALVALATPAHALDYDCSPLTGGCTPRASQSSAWFDCPTIYRPPPPRSTCPIDGPGALTCDRDRAESGRQVRGALHENETHRVVGLAADAALAILSNHRLPAEAGVRRASGKLLASIGW